MPVIGAGKTEEEMEKRLGAAVIAGWPLICLDNVVGELGGDALCRLIEQERPHVRVLGLSELVEVEARGISVFRQRQQRHHLRRLVPAGGHLSARSEDGAPRAEEVQGEPGGA